MESLTEFIQTSREPRELKRALAVQMIQQNYPYSQIKEVLKVSVGFILFVLHSRSLKDYLN